MTEPAYPRPRALALAFLGLACICLTAPYNDFVLHNTPLIGNHFPVSCVCTLILLSGLVNPLLRRLKPEWALAAPELVVVFVLMTVGASVVAAGLWRYVANYMAAPAYYATEENGFFKHLLAGLPDWELLAKRPEDPAVVGFYEGLSRGVALPWGAWLRPLAAWSVYLAGMYISVISLCLLFSGQWILRERLTFPLTYLPAQLAEDPEPGKLWNSFYRNRLVWVFALIPGLIHGINGFRMFSPSWPQVPLEWSTYGLFQNRPWDAFNMANAHIYFSIVGISFLLTSEISFSIWFFYLAYRLSYVMISALGLPSSGYFSDWWQKVGVFQTTGVFLTLAGFIFYVARGQLGLVLGSALSRRSQSPAAAPRPWAARLLLGGCLLGPGLMTGWLIAAGVRWPFALGLSLMLICIFLVLTRLIAEAGLMYIGTTANPMDFFFGLFTAKALGAATVAQLGVQRGALMQDYRECWMPYAANGLKLGGQFRLRKGFLALGFVGALGLGLVLSLVGLVGTSYRHGMANMDWWGSRGSPNIFLPAAANFNKAETPPKPPGPGAAHLATGALGAAFLLFLRSRLLWWPLHPFGWVVCTEVAIERTWFSIFLGWLAKALVMRLGGPAAYRKLLPGFLGLVLGESLMAGLWALVSLCAGIPGVEILPG